MTALPVSATDNWIGFRHEAGDGDATIEALAADPFGILEAVGVPIVVLRRDFTIALFNRAAIDVLDLASSDVGRSPGTTSVLAGLPHLESWCARVASTGAPTQHDLRAKDSSFVVRIAPFVESDGQNSGVVLTFTNVTAFAASIDQAIYEREYTKAILNAVPDPLVVLDSELRVQTGNKAFYTLCGVSRDAIKGVALRAVGGGAFNVERLETELTAMICENCPFRPFEVNLETSGKLRSVLLHASPLSLPRHSAPMVLLDVQDISHVRLLAHEVDHRSKNLLAVVQATVHLTHAETADDLKAAIEGRIQALSKVHTLLAQSRWTGADLSNLVKEELSPFSSEGTSRTEIRGPDMILDSHQAQSIAIVLYELATNAAKYGALSVPSGRVRVEWSHAADGRAVLHWNESGGPPVKPPTRRGFGTRVCEQIIGSELNGVVNFDWRPGGLACRIEFRQ